MAINFGLGRITISMDGRKNLLTNDWATPNTQETSLILVRGSLASV